MRLSKPLTIALPLAALAIAGCGGGDDDSTASTAATTAAAPALSKADLLSQGDAICAEVNAAVGAAAASETEDAAAQVPALYIGMVESIERLGTPEEDAGYADFIAAAEELAKVEGEAKLAAEREDSAALAAAPTEAALEEFQNAATEYGFQDCGEGPTAPVSSGTAPGEAPVEEGGVEAAPEEEVEEAPLEEVVPEEAAPETGGAGGGVEEAAPEPGGGTGGGSSGGVGPG